MLKAGSQRAVSFLYFLPPICLALPLGMPNTISQPLAVLLCLPAVFFGGITISSLVITIIFFSMIFLNSLVQSIVYSAKEYSIYQAVRSLIPFVIMILIITSYKYRLNAIKRNLVFNSGRLISVVERAIGIYAVLCLVQTITFFSGINLANAISMSQSNGRVMIFQTTSCVLLSHYAIERKRFFILFCLIVVSLGSGSKSVLVSLILVVMVSVFSKLSVTRLLRGGAAIIVLMGSILFVNPTAFQRTMDFAAGSGINQEMGDVTRAYEIAHAKQTLLSGGGTLAFGAGFLIQLTPGVSSRNAAWESNSKYDIENGYWGVFTKLGIFFTAFLIIIFIINVPISRVIFCAIIIESMMFFKTSYQIFAYMDGVYLIIWMLLISAILDLTNYNVKLSAKAHQD